MVKAVPARVSDRIIQEDRRASAGLSADAIQQVHGRGHGCRNEDSGNDAPLEDSLVFSSRCAAAHTGQQIKALPLFVSSEGHRVSEYPCPEIPTMLTVLQTTPNANAQLLPATGGNGKQKLRYFHEKQDKRERSSRV